MDHKNRQPPGAPGSPRASLLPTTCPEDRAPSSIRCTRFLLADKKKEGKMMSCTAFVQILGTLYLQQLKTSVEESRKEYKEVRITLRMCPHETRVCFRGIE
ncbi:unnamed protein product [Caenorhabditis auriculariae]|uniref:Uncharacterized protein n=1 Tax=Caenorhabditis auriculariae TaxID=2777116 RepID=A0A8S1HSX2_9PELO|nr:unnamed protein product [Caenorhabditis auriculariae]